MNREQHKYLDQRIKDAERKEMGRWPDWESRSGMPANVRAAFDLVRSWRQKGEQVEERRRASIKARGNKCREEFHFGDYARALAAVKRFEGGK